MTEAPTYIDTEKPDGLYCQWAPIVEESLDDWDGDAPEPVFLFSVYAEARLMLVRSGTGVLITLRSPGLHNVGVNSATDPYLTEVYREEQTELRAILAGLAGPLVDEGPALLARPRWMRPEEAKP